MRSRAVSTDGFSLKRCILDAIFSGLVALIIFGPIAGVVLDGYSFNFAGQKELGRDDFSKIPNGMPGIENRPALMYTYGVCENRITKEQMAAMLSENTARLFGMYPRKGALQVGSDADIVVYDPEADTVITAQTQLSAAGYTPYEGFEVKGRARAVFLGGELAARDGEPLREGLGRFVCREESQC